MIAIVVASQVVGHDRRGVRVRALWNGERHIQAQRHVALSNEMCSTFSPTAAFAVTPALANGRRKSRVLGAPAAVLATMISSRLALSAIASGAASRTSQARPSPLGSPRARTARARARVRRRLRDVNVHASAEPDPVAFWRPIHSDMSQKIADAAVEAVDVSPRPDAPAPVSATASRTLLVWLMVVASFVASAHLVFGSFRVAVSAASDFKRRAGGFRGDPFGAQARAPPALRLGFARRRTFFRGRSTARLPPSQTGLAGPCRGRPLAGALVRLGDAGDSGRLRGRLDAVRLGRVHLGRASPRVVGPHLHVPDASGRGRLGRGGPPGRFAAGLRGGARRRLLTRPGRPHVRARDRARKPRARARGRHRRSEGGCVLEAPGDGALARGPQLFLVRRVEGFLGEGGAGIGKPNRAAQGSRSSVRASDALSSIFLSLSRLFPSIPAAGRTLSAHVSLTPSSPPFPRVLATATRSRSVAWTCSTFTAAAPSSHPRTTAR